MDFDLFIGIDYSGAKTSTSRLPGLQIYSSCPKGLHPAKCSPASENVRPRNWSRREIAEWLIGLAGKVRFIAGIDHGFSFPLSYFDRHQLENWPQFLEDFVEHCPTHLDAVTVESLRHSLRTGSTKDFRLCEKWTSSTQSVFKLDGQGIVGKSTHAGIPWLKHIRDVVGDRVHIWPFDGWQIPESKCVLAEVYPSIFRNRYVRDDRSTDEQDAYAVSRWLSESMALGSLSRYFDPPLSLQERQIAEKEGWILGIT